MQAAGDSLKEDNSWSFGTLESRESGDAILLLIRQIINYLK